MTKSIICFLNSRDNAGDGETYLNVQHPRVKLM